MADGMSDSSGNAVYMSTNGPKQDPNNMIPKQAQPMTNGVMSAFNGVAPQTQNPVQQQQVQNPYITQPAQQSGLSGAGTNRGYN